jgi:hypothetical protein
MNEFNKTWERCLTCDQYYQNKLAVDIANKFILFVRRQYPSDTEMQLEAIMFYSKLCALKSMFVRLTPVQKMELGVTANVLLSLIDRMKGDASPLSIRYSHFESYASTVVLLLKKEQKRVQEGRLPPLRINWR